MLALLGEFLFSSWVYFRFVKDVTKRRHFSKRKLALTCKLILKVLNIDLEVQGLDKIRAQHPGENFLVVSNHLSYVDVILMETVFPMLFITSVEVKNSFGLGAFVEYGACLFVERRNRNNISGEITEITDALKEGWNVMVFAEATSTNGDTVLPFKKSLFDSAILSGRKVLPLTLVYTEVNGNPIAPEVRDSIFYYGDIEFGTQFLAMLRLKSVKAKLFFLAPLPTDPDRRVLAQKAHDGISTLYHAESPLARRSVLS
ncbi:1-acyl-sn-glycerol-3-phosphate acyltransferase [bacterium]|jgi:1-acyl-sn-glycerol-3-phosphate acyltransferase|nr:1-acyl-sn-glycerol-3-phosphate acyltransferase [bacterium]